jgi:hypothetical protein
VGASIGSVTGNKAAPGQWDYLLKNPGYLIGDIGGQILGGIAVGYAFQGVGAGLQAARAAEIPIVSRVAGGALDVGAYAGKVVAAPFKAGNALIERGTGVDIGEGIASLFPPSSSRLISGTERQAASSESGSVFRDVTLTTAKEPVSPEKAYLESLFNPTGVQGNKLAEGAYTTIFKEPSAISTGARVIGEETGLTIDEASKLGSSALRETAKGYSPEFQQIERSILMRPTEGGLEVPASVLEKGMPASISASLDTGERTITQGGQSLAYRGFGSGRPEVSFTSTYFKPTGAVGEFDEQALKDLGFSKEMAEQFIKGEPAPKGVFGRVGDWLKPAEREEIIRPTTAPDIFGKGVQPVELEQSAFKPIGGITPVEESEVGKDIAKDFTVSRGGLVSTTTKEETKAATIPYFGKVSESEVGQYLRYPSIGLALQSGLKQGAATETIAPPAFKLDVGAGLDAGFRQMPTTGQSIIPKPDQGQTPFRIPDQPPVTTVKPYVPPWTPMPPPPTITITKEKGGYVTGFQPPPSATGGPFTFPTLMTHGAETGSPPKNPWKAWGYREFHAEIAKNPLGNLGKAMKKKGKK